MRDFQFFDAMIHLDEAGCNRDTCVPLPNSPFTKCPSPPMESLLLVQSGQWQADEVQGRLEAILDRLKDLRIAVVVLAEPDDLVNLEHKVRQIGGIEEHQIGSGDSA